MTDITKRRDFLKKLAALTAAITIPAPLFPYGRNLYRDRIGETLPLRKLGKTGKEVTMLGLGGYHIGWTTERDAQETIEAAIEGGIRFFDSAESYGPHTGEIRYGKFLVPKYRDHVFIMTKTQGKDAKTVREHLDASLKRMNCDYIDLWQIHQLDTPNDVDLRVDQGVLDVFREAKASGKVRYIGFTGHQNPAAHRAMLEKTEGENIFDTCQMPINIVDAASEASFIGTVLPRLTERNIGVLAMKTLADGRFFANKVMGDRQIWNSPKPVVPDLFSIKQALEFVWSLPVSVLITGAENASLVKEKIGFARSFMEMSQAERESLITKVARFENAKQVEYYKRVS